MKPKRDFVWHVAINRQLTAGCSLPRSTANPLAGGVRFYGIPVCVEEIKNSIRDVELVDCIDHSTLCAGAFDLSDSRGAHELLRGAMHRIFELLRDLKPNYTEEGSAKEYDD